MCSTLNNEDDVQHLVVTTHDDLQLGIQQNLEGNQLNVKTSFSS